MAHSYLIARRIKVLRAAEETGLYHPTGTLISHVVVLVDARFSSSLRVTAEE